MSSTHAARRGPAMPPAAITRAARAGLAATLGLAAAAAPALAADGAERPPPLRLGGLEGGPSLEFGVGFMQAFQALQAESGAFAPIDEEASPGFQRLRFNLTLGFTLNDRISGAVDLGHEPGDFGDDFAPAVDLALLDLKLVDGLVLQLGTPVTALFNFRGYSDGAAVQGNPLIGNSPADMVTAETGIKLIGSFDPVSFDLTATVPSFFEDFGPDRGYTLIGKAAVDLGAGFKLGAAYLFARNGAQIESRGFADARRVGLVQGDGEIYNFPSSPASARDTHAGTIPGLDVQCVHADLEFNPAFFDRLLLQVWYGYLWDDYRFVDATGAQTVARQATDVSADGSAIDFIGATLKLTVYDDLYVAGRYTHVTNRSEGVGDDAVLSRLQVGAGFPFWRHALLKVEYVRQTEGEDSPGQIGADWSGGLAELSVAF